jgi:hypothetical protein
MVNMAAPIKTLRKNQTWAGSATLNGNLSPQNKSSVTALSDPPHLESKLDPLHRAIEVLQPLVLNLKMFPSGKGRVQVAFDNSLKEAEMARTFFQWDAERSVLSIPSKVVDGEEKVVPHLRALVDAVYGLYKERRIEAFMEPSIGLNVQEASKENLSIHFEAEKRKAECLKNLIEQEHLEKKDQLKTEWNHFELSYLYRQLHVGEETPPELPWPQTLVPNLEVKPCLAQLLKGLDRGENLCGVIAQGFKEIVSLPTPFTQHLLFKYVYFLLTTEIFKERLHMKSSKDPYEKLVGECLPAEQSALWLLFCYFPDLLSRHFVLTRCKFKLVEKIDSESSLFNTLIPSLLHLLAEIEKAETKQRIDFKDLHACLEPLKPLDQDLKQSLWDRFCSDYSRIQKAEELLKPLLQKRFLEDLQNQLFHAKGNIDLYALYYQLKQGKKELPHQFATPISKMDEKHKAFLLNVIDQLCLPASQRDPLQLCNEWQPYYWEDLKAIAEVYTGGGDDILVYLLNKEN